MSLAFRTFSVAAVLLGLNASPGAWAEAMRLEEVVVTAQKREQSLQDVPISISVMTGEQIKEIGEIYLEGISRETPNCRFFVDTMPGNYKHVGLILQALPRAKIVYCRRDPLDNCLVSYFKTYEHGNEYSYRFDRLASYCAGYMDLMAHWLGLYGERILCLRYEEMVRKPEETALRLYRFCGLDFDAATIRHAFKTDEIGIWRHYEPYIGPLRDALVRSLVTFDNP